MKLKKIIGCISWNKSKTKISLRGGWCEELSGEFSIGHVTDQDLAKVLRKILENQTVAGFGDGPGEYRRLIIEMYKVKSYDA
jgi:hypothetical protein